MAVAIASTKQIVEKLFTEIDRNIKMLCSVRVESDFLRRELKILAAYKIDDELRNGKNGPRQAAGAREFGEQMRTLMHDMEDCIERFLHRITCSKETGLVGRLNRAAHQVKTLVIRFKFAKELETLKQRLQDLSKHESLRHDPASTATQAQPRHLPMEEAPVGIAMAKNHILIMLVHNIGGDVNSLRVISIVGFGGSGKTTLANAVYKDPAVDTQRFPLRAWVRRSHYQDESGLLKKIIKGFWKEAGEADTRDMDRWELQEYLQQKLQQQRCSYLLVLVDMDDFNHWHWIESTFKDYKATGSRIIVTTSMLSMANRCSSYGYGYIYQMRKLGDECSEQIAMGRQPNDGDPCSRKAILKKCDGHPLALVSVANHICGRVISNSPNREPFTELSNRLGSFLHAVPGHGTDDHFADLRGVLIDNYSSLSLYYCSVQPSFLYLGIFQNDDCSLKRKKITRRWMAEGYARSGTNRVSEQEVADKNFKEFINRNIIQPAGVSSSKCKALAIVHEFVVDKSISDNFIMPFNAQEHRAGITHRQEKKVVRHLFVDGRNLASTGSNVKMDLARVRSLTVFSESAGGALSKLSKYRLMRVLDLEKCKEVNHRHLIKICKLWNLRYLSLSRDNIKKLPRAIAQLKLLETLVISKTKVTELPVQVLGMPCLIHLSGKFTLPKKLPKEDRLEKLCQDNRLQTVTGFVADGNQGFLQLMVHSNNLRKVKIWCVPAGEVTVTSNLNNDLVGAILKYSKAITLEDGKVGYRSLSIVDFQISSQEPSPDDGTSYYYLGSLKLHGNLSTMPWFVDKLSVHELKYLCLSLTLLTRELLAAIHNFRYLHHLKLVIADGVVTEDGVIEIGEFKKLERLYFSITSTDAAIPRIRVHEGYLPQLASLQLLSKHLAGTCGMEITHLTKLREIELHPDVSEAAKQEWEEAARNHPNWPNILPFKGIDDPVATVAPEPIQNPHPVAGATQAGEDELIENPIASTATPVVGDVTPPLSGEPAVSGTVVLPAADGPIQDPVASTAQAGEEQELTTRNSVSGAAVPAVNNSAVDPVTGAARLVRNGSIITNPIADTASSPAVHVPVEHPVVSTRSVDNGHTDEPIAGTTSKESALPDPNESPSTIGANNVPLCPIINPGQVCEMVDPTHINQGTSAFTMPLPLDSPRSSSIQPIIKA